MDFPCELFDPNFIDNLIHLPKMSVYGFINLETKKIFIGYSRNTIQAICRQIKNPLLKGDLKKVSFIIIETIDDPINLRVRYEYWVNEYRNLGFIMYRQHNAITYKAQIGVMDDISSLVNGKLQFTVKLRSRRRKELIVGVFETLEEANGFIELNYPNGVVNRVIYADNTLTTSYLQVLREIYG